MSGKRTKKTSAHELIKSVCMKKEKQAGKILPACYFGIYKTNNSITSKQKNIIFLMIF